MLHHLRCSRRRGLSAALLLTLLAGAAAAVQEGESAFERARRLHARGEPSFAAFEAVLADETATERQRFEAAYELAVQSLARREGERALRFLARADGLVPGRPLVALRRVDALLDLDRARQARRAFEAMEYPAHVNADVHARLELVRARLLHVRGRSGEALERLERLASRRPGDWEPFHVMGAIHEEEGAPQEALRAYERAIANDPGRDPFRGIDAYERWVALLLSTDPSSRTDEELRARAQERCRVFLERAEANGVPDTVLQRVRRAAEALAPRGTEPPATPGG